MVSCTQAYSAGQAECMHFIQKPLTRVALFAIGVLCAAAAVLSYFVGLGFVGMASFSFGCGFSLTAFLVSCAKNSSSKSTSENAPPVPTPSQDTPAPATAPTPPIQLPQPPIETLINLNDFPTFRNLSIRRLPAFNIGLATDDEAAGLARLKREIQALFDEHASDGPEAVVDALVPYFPELYQRPVKLLILASKLPFNSYSALFISTVLSQLIEECPQPIKERIAGIMVEELARDANRIFACQNESNGLHIRLCFDRFFGRGDFTQNPQEIPDLLKHAFVSVLQKSRKNIHLIIQPTSRCHFPPSMILPLLSDLKNCSMHSLALLDLTLSEEEAQVVVELVQGRYSLNDVNVRVVDGTGKSSQAFVEAMSTIFYKRLNPVSYQES